MADTIDRLVRMLDEERSHHIRISRDLGSTQMRDRQEINRLESNLRAAEAKVEEWRGFAAALLDLIGPKRFKEVPKPPAPLEYDIPF